MLDLLKLKFQDVKNYYEKLKDIKKEVDINVSAKQKEFSGNMVGATIYGGQFHPYELFSQFMLSEAVMTKMLLDYKNHNFRSSQEIFSLKEKEILNYLIADLKLSRKYVLETKKELNEKLQDLSEKSIRVSTKVSKKVYNSKVDSDKFNKELYDEYFTSSTNEADLIKKDIEELKNLDVRIKECSSALEKIVESNVYADQAQTVNFEERLKFIEILKNKYSGLDSESIIRYVQTKEEEVVNVELKVANNYRRLKIERGIRKMALAAMAVLSFNVLSPHQDRASHIDSEAVKSSINAASGKLKKENVADSANYVLSNLKLDFKEGAATLYANRFVDSIAFAGQIYSHNDVFSAVPIGSAWAPKILETGKYEVAILEVKNTVTGKTIKVPAYDIGNFGLTKYGRSNTYDSISVGNKKLERVADFSPVVAKKLGIKVKYDKNGEPVTSFPVKVTLVDKKIIKYGEKIKLYE
ncbi:MAG: hypothetical protein ACP5N3_01935 [Candidatus Nanoarchaeia archaeon]